ncbi:hypothetical protein BP5796_01821 [Coleophoma crateriformis]|uniref:Uncharacterized protein n=1 Tax=Coleophoma crateriformis TaxID=565419 RepID=A0A3D8T1H1_9HELO|nr:hypothetical protein BP5796_01821 [Coleophoma crateriformis]
MPSTVVLGATWMQGRPARSSGTDGHNTTTGTALTDCYCTIAGLDDSLTAIDLEWAGEEYSDVLMTPIEDRTAIAVAPCVFTHTTSGKSTICIRWYHLRNPVRPND